ncbi:MAG: TonB-dependent receptor [Gammaproteobacteria bacterium]|nr:TonB-dependent receptor [Gammaproteobacteria bacterium]
MTRSATHEHTAKIRLAGCSLALFLPLATASDMADDEVYHLGEIVVRGEDPGVEAIATVYELNALDIERKAARTLDEAIELLPGVNIRTGADGTPRIDVRGFRTRQVKLLINGVPFNSTFDGQFDPTMIPTESIAKIKLTSGASSELYGEGAEAAVINIITKKGATGFHAQAAGEVGDRGHQRIWGSASGGIDNADFRVSLSHQDRDGFPLSRDFVGTPEESGGLRNNSDRRRTNVYANAGYRPNDDWSLGLSFNHAQGEHGIPSSVINDNTDVFANRPRYERVNDEAIYASQFSVAYDPEGPWSSKNWAYLNIVDEQGNRYDDATLSSMSSDRVNGTFDLSSSTRIAGGHTQTSYDHGWGGQLTIMGDAREESWEQQGVIRDVRLSAGGGGGGGGGGGASQRFGLRDVDENRSIGVVSTAAELTFSPIENLGIALGYGHHWLFRDDNSSADDSSFIAGAHYDLPTDTRLRASASRKIRVPSIRQLYDGNGGDPNLRFETSYNYEAGIMQQLPGRTQIGVTGFLNDVENFIERDNDGFFRNFAKYEFQGVEIIGESRFIDDLLLRTSYTYLHSRDRSDTEGRDELQYRPKHKLAFETDYQFGYGFSGYLNVMHVADEYYYSRNLPLQKARLEAYTLLNMKLNYSFFNNQAAIYVGADNILDADYQESYALPQAGRFVYTGARLSF